jgi:uncharacterized protein YjiK
MPEYLRLKGLSIAIAFYLIFSVSACQSSPKAAILPTQNLKQLELPAVLREISGIAFSRDGRLFGHHDEHAIIFQLNPQNSEIVKTFFVGEPLKGDFEDLEIVDDIFYLVKANGNILEFKEGKAGEHVEHRMYKTFLKKDNNVEGLCYDPQTHSLLLALKGHAGEAISDEFRAVYSFSLETTELNPKPRFILETKSVSDLSSENSFAPSGIAYDDSTNHFVLIAAVGNVIVRITNEGVVKDVYQLDKNLHFQPEGVAFYKNNLYIADEGEYKGMLSVYPKFK